MKYLLIGILFLKSSYSMAVGTCDYVDESFESGADVFSIDDYYDSSRPLDEYELWKIKLDQFLIQHDDINLNIIGLAGLSEPYLDRIDVHTGQPLISKKQKMSLINRLLESYDVTYSSLVVAQDVCNQKTFGIDCPIKAIQEKLIERAPENMIAYLYDLENAVNDDDAEMIDAILERMSQAEYAQMLLQFEPSFKSVLSTYINENPLPENTDDGWLSEYEEQFKDVDMDVLQLNNISINYAMQKITYMPAFRPMMIACEQYQSNSKNCINIAKIFTEKSDSFLSVRLGNGLMEKIHEVNGNVKELELLEKVRTEFSDYMMCVAKAQAIGDGIDMLIDPQVNDLFFYMNHEGETFEQMALYLYDKHKELGTENITDPRTCGLRYVKE